jgi:hypothetical protein
MEHRLRALGVSAVAALALSAASASVASAGIFHFSAESTVLTGEALGTQVLETTANQEFRCEKVSIEKGTVVGKTVEKITFKPKYEGCIGELFEEAVVAANVELTECAYEATSGTDENEHAKLRIECPNENEHIHFKYTALKLICVDIPAQEVTGLHYQNTGQTTEFEQRTLDIDATAEGLVTTTKGACKFPEESEVHNNGTFNGAFNLKGHNTIKEPSDVFYE